MFGVVVKGVLFGIVDVICIVYDLFVLCMLLYVLIDDFVVLGIDVSIWSVLCDEVEVVFVFGVV